MSLCEKKIQNYSNQNSPKECKSTYSNKKTIQFWKSKEISACTFLNGSYTLEAAIIFPLVAATIVTFVLFFRILQIGTGVQAALIYTSRMTAVEATTFDNDAALLASAEGFFNSKISSNSNIKQYVYGGTLGVSLLDSEFDNNKIKLRARYIVKLPVGFFNITGVTIVQNSVNTKWTGKDISKEKDEGYVYYTEDGTVYHTTTSCTYLDLSISGIKSSEISSARNQNGAKYSACSYCVAKKMGNNTYFITNYGTKYHISCACKNLKRTIHMIKKSEVGGRPPCSKCGSQ